MELEVRNDKGEFKISFLNEMADSVLSFLMNDEEFKRDARKYRKKSGEIPKEYITFTPVLETGSYFKNSLFIIKIEKGDYIKVIK